jgi:hypothetical protein
MKQRPSAAIVVLSFLHSIDGTIAGTVVTCFVTDVHKEELHLLLSQTLKWCVYVITVW